MTVVNKWDRPGRDALALMDEIQARTGLRPTPLTWPVGVAGDFRGVLDRRSGGFVKFTRTAGGASIAPQGHIEPGRRTAREGAAWAEAGGERELLAADGYDHDQASTWRSDHAGAVRRGGPELRDRSAARRPVRPRAAARRAPGRRRSAARPSSAVQRPGVQGPGGDGLRPPRPAGLRPRQLRGLPPRRRPDPRADRRRSPRSTCMPCSGSSETLEIA